MRRSRLSVASIVTLSLLVNARSAEAEPTTRTVSGPRVELGELLPDAPEMMRAIDICPTPRAGTSRLLERQVIERQVRAAGFDVKGLSIPPSIRLEREGHRHTPAELATMLHGPVSRALPAGVTLVQIEPSVSLFLEPGATPRQIVLPKLPHRIGAVKVAFAVEFDGADAVGIRLPVTAVVQIADAATHSAVTQGTRVQLLIERGAARVSADATALSDGDVGEELRFRVSSTGKVLKALLVSPKLAKVSD